LYNERQIIRAGLEDHFMGKLLGLPMGCDVCYTNHADADQNSTDNLLLLLTAAGCNYFMGVPCSDDVMLNYQSMTLFLLSSIADWQSSTFAIYSLQASVMPTTRRGKFSPIFSVFECFAPKCLSRWIFSHAASLKAAEFA
jgi:hypothetical protein